MHRRSRLQPMIEAIEAREHAERIRQGYISAPLEGEGLAAIAGPSRATHSSLTYPFPASQHSAIPPLSTQKSQGAEPPNQSSAARVEAEYPIPSAQSPGVAPPRETIDPSRHTSGEDLRKLAEEDTKRRMARSRATVPPPVGKDEAQGVNVGQGGFAPRRRGR